MSINQKISLEFSADLDISSVDDSSVYILDKNNDLVGLYIGVGNPDNKIILTPYEFLKPSSIYSIVVTTRVKDIQNRSLSQNYVYQFTTLSDTLDTTPLKIRAIKPDNGSSNILAQTNIAIDFNKNLSLKPQYTHGEYIKVFNSVNNTPISGETEVFNSILKFIPFEPLPKDTMIKIELMTPITDIYGNDFTTPTSWSFKTELIEPESDISVEFNSLALTSTNKSSYIVRTIFNSMLLSKIAVATQDGIDIYLVHFTEFPTKPKLEYLSSYKLPSKVNSMVSFESNYLLAGTMNNGVYTLKVDTNGVTLVGNYINNASIYGVSLGKSNDGILDRAYGVGPDFGLQIFDLNSRDGILTPTIFKDKSVVGKALDVLETKETSSDTNTELKKIFIADYDGSVIILDEKGSFLTKTDLNGSIKGLIFNHGYYTDMGIYAISSLGKVYGLGLDGSINSNIKLDLVDNPSDVISYMDDMEMVLILFFSDGDKGIFVTKGDYPKSIIDTDGEVVSSDIVKGSISATPFLVTLNKDGKLQIFNAHPTNYHPIVWTTPWNDSTLSSSGYFRANFHDKYLDTSSINKSSFTFKDNTEGVLVDFTLSVKYGEFDFECMLIPVYDLVPNHKYTVVIDSSISDMSGNRLNGGVDEIINITVEYSHPKTNLDISAIRKLCNCKAKGCRSY